MDVCSDFFLEHTSTGHTLGTIQANSEYIDYFHRLDVILDDLDRNQTFANTIPPDLDPDVTFANTIGPVFEALSTWNNSIGDDPRQLVLEIWPCRRENRAERRRDVDLPRPAYPASLFPLPQARAVTTLLLQQNGRFRPRQDALLWLLRSLPALEKIGSEKRKLPSTPLSLPFRVERRKPRRWKYRPQWLAE